jgi:hypothetical protein
VHRSFAQQQQRRRADVTALRPAAVPAVPATATRAALATQGTARVVVVGMVTEPPPWSGVASVVEVR